MDPNEKDSNDGETCDLTGDEDQRDQLVVRIVSTFKLRKFPIEILRKRKVSRLLWSKS